MPPYTILMSNLGYLRGINGGLAHHLLYAHRHLYCPVSAQKKALHHLALLLEKESPDLCCFVEIDKGSANSAYFNQLEALVNDTYPFFDIENKYAASSRRRNMAFLRGKSNGFLARRPVVFEKIYFTHGTKRLIYKITLSPRITLFFAHFSLRKSVRTQQLHQVGELLAGTEGESIFIGDFNILSGFQELAPLLSQGRFRLLNHKDIPTFRFHRMERTLDLCIASAGLAPSLHLRVIPQPFSDHAALLLHIH